MKIPGYKGNSIFTRGRFAHRRIIYTVQQLDTIIRDYVATVYHLKVHRSLHPGSFPVGDMSPLQKFDEGITRAGVRIVPDQANVAIELLPVRWRAMSKGGIEINNLLYRGEILKDWIGKDSAWDEKNGDWPFAYNPDNVRSIFFKDPRDGKWYELLSAEALEYNEPFSLSMMQQALHDAFDGLPRNKKRKNVSVTNIALRNLSDKWGFGMGLTPKQKRARLRRMRDEATFSAQKNGVTTAEPVTRPAHRADKKVGAPSPGGPSSSRRNRNRKTY